MTGESAVRRAEDVAAQELSYAEVKAIASGNPAVLTLAEADAELQRLAVLRRNHADEQYLARRNLRELPQSIERLEKRLAALTADMNTIRGNNTFLVGKQPMAEATLARALDALPENVDRPQRFPLGTYHGLAFGIERHPGGNADVYLEGRTLRLSKLSRDAQGPRAVTNALTRLSASYVEQCESIRKEKTLAETQLRDYQARHGLPFAHTDYLEELNSLRDRLKIALSETPADGEPSAGELAERIATLKTTHAVEAAPARMKTPKPRMESIRERVEQEDDNPETAGGPHHTYRFANRRDNDDLQIIR